MAQVKPVRWVGFGSVGALSQTLIHFFPSEGSTSAPYPAQCTLRVFGESIEASEVTIDGARMGQPDGLRIEDAFPSLKSAQVGLIGIEVVITSEQSKVDFTRSGCIIEIVSGENSARYVPRKIMMEPAAEDSRSFLTATTAQKDVEQSLKSGGMLVRDGFHETSIVVVNGDENALNPAMFVVGSTGERDNLSVSQLPPRSVREDSCGDAVFEGTPVIECSSGSMQAKSVVLEELNPFSRCAAFLVYRDRRNHRPVSIGAV